MPIFPSEKTRAASFDDALPEKIVIPLLPDPVPTTRLSAFAKKESGSVTPIPTRPPEVIRSLSVPSVVTLK